MNALLAPLLESAVGQANVALSVDQAIALSQAISLSKIARQMDKLNENILILANMVENFDHAVRNR